MYIVIYICTINYHETSTYRHSVKLKATHVKCILIPV